MELSEGYWILFQETGNYQSLKWERKCSLHDQVYVLQRSSQLLCEELHFLSALFSSPGGGQVGVFVWVNMPMILERPWPKVSFLPGHASLLVCLSSN